MHELEGSLNRKPLLGELSSSYTPVTATVIFSTSIAVCGSFAYGCALLANCGFSIIYFLGNVVSWRNLAIIGLAPGILQLLGLFFVPESPRWLAQVGRRREFEASLKSLRGKDTDINHEKQEIQISYFQIDPKICTIQVGVGLMVFQQFGGVSGVASYASAIVQRSGFSTKTGTIIISLIQVPAAAAGLFLMDYAGRKPVLMVSAGGMCLCSILVGVAFVLQGLNLLKNITPIMTVLGLTIFPMSVKAVAGSLVTLVSWSASWVVTYTFNFMLQWSPAGTFFIFAGMCGASIMFTWKLVPETKGRTLEEIQSSMIGLQ
ncbi:Sugar transporter ERD6-like 17 [Linum perenne]